MSILNLIDKVAEENYGVRGILDILDGYVEDVAEREDIRRRLEGCKEFNNKHVLLAMLTSYLVAKTHRELGVAKFEKVSYENFLDSMQDEFPSMYDEDIKEAYDSLLLPKRATKGSAGYDFYSPINFTLVPGQTIKIPTGIRCKIKDTHVLQVFPRSGLGFKYRCQLDNTVGIIDSDYYESDNEGHIFVKLTNDSKKAKVLTIDKGVGICQGIFLKYGITEDDDADGIRNGGFGSTTK